MQPFTRLIEDNAAIVRGQKFLVFPSERIGWWLW
jgi:hypothetical protein